MVIGDQHLDTPGPGGGDTVHAGDTVIHGDDQVRPVLLLGQLDNGRRQSVPIFEAVRHQEIRAREAQQLKASHHQGGGGGTIRVVVADNTDTPVVGSPL